MRFLFAILLFLLAVSLGTTLKCYFCAGSIHSDCAKSKTSSMVQQECPGPHNMSFSDVEGNDIQVDFKQYCVKFIIPFNESMAFMRTCMEMPSTIKICDYVKEKLHGKYCKSCTTPLCNK